MTPEVQEIGPEGEDREGGETVDQREEGEEDGAGHEGGEEEEEEGGRRRVLPTDTVYYIRDVR